ncbi:uncharacterized protein LOC143465962 isoform X3 [Clavelina lepadiformis]|uniref:uncharacterized protein LOC143465962 isoform X3 n=1 Tax=Clavelina lepadiformis TaxID=159417 RepID=UPI004042EB5D
MNLSNILEGNISIENQTHVSQSPANNNNRPDSLIDRTLSNVNAKGSSQSPYALHKEVNKENKNGVVNSPLTSSPSAPSKSFSLYSGTSLVSLRAPYAQPVLDASKVQKPKTSVDERIASVRERRLQQQQMHGSILLRYGEIDDKASQRRALAEASQAKWEQSQEEKRLKMEENKDKEGHRRKEVEERKNKQLMEDKKHAEAIVARTDQQAQVVLRQKRNASADRTKRWSWGAGYAGSGSGGQFDISSSFSYSDSTRVTKRTPSNGEGKGDTQLNSAIGTSASGSPATNRSSTIDSKFSKSPLVMSTQHMAFASALRSYESPPHNTSKNNVQPRRARSVDIKSKTHKSSNDSVATRTKPAKTMEANAATTSRGRSPGLSRQSKKGDVSHLTEPNFMNSRLLAPTKASTARSIKHDSNDSHLSLSSSGPLRSRSSDRKYPTTGRPSSVRSDTSSTSSTYSSPRGLNERKSKPRTARAPSPSLNKTRPSQRAPSPALASSKRSPKAAGDSPKLKPLSPATNRTPESKETPKRRPSPARRSSPSPVSISRNTSIRNHQQLNKSTPPPIKPSLRPSPASSLKSETAKSGDKKKNQTKTSKEKKVESKPNKSVKLIEVKRNEEKHHVETNKEKPSATVEIVDVGASDGVIVTSSEEMNVTITVQSHDEDKLTQVVEIETNSKDQSDKQDTPNSIDEVHTTNGMPIVELTYENKAKQEEPEQHLSSTLEVDIIEKTMQKVEVTENKFNDQNKEIDLDLNLQDEINFALSSTQDSEVNSKSASSTKEHDIENIETSSDLSKDTENAEDNVGLERPVHYASLVEDQDFEQMTEVKASEISEKVIIEAKQELREEFLEVGKEENPNPEVYLVDNDETAEKEAETANEEVTNPAETKIRPETSDESFKVSDEETVEVKHEQFDSPVVNANETISATTPEASEIPFVEPKQQDQAEKNTEASPEKKSDIKNEINVPTGAPVETLKKQKKLSPEEQAYKDAIAAKRREMKEKREREEQERQERMRREAEEQQQREEAARQMAEEARLEQEKMMEEEKIRQQEIENKRKQEAEEAARKHEEYLRLQREKLEQKAREDAEKIRRERELAAQKKDEERMARKKRLEMIMRRTRGGGDSPTNTAANPSTSGELSSGNVTPSGGRSPYNSVTPDRVSSPVTVQGSTNRRSSAELHLPNSDVMRPMPGSSSSNSIASDDVETISLSKSTNNIQSHVPCQPIVAFAENVNGSVDDLTAVNGGNHFAPITQGNSREPLHNALDPLPIKTSTMQQDVENGNVPNNNYNAFEDASKKKRRNR